MPIVDLHRQNLESNNMRHRLLIQNDETLNLMFTKWMNICFMLIPFLCCHIMWMWTMLMFQSYIHAPHLQGQSVSQMGEFLCTYFDS